MTPGMEISVTLLNNRYHGAEWPCSPARLFRALLAGTMTGGNRQYMAEAEPALQWLERQAAPEIDAVKAKALERYRISVPNNDMDVAAKEWVAGRVYDAAKLRALKTITPRIVEGAGPHLVYRWRDIQPDGPTEKGLRHAVHALHTLGWGVDMAYAELRLDGGADCNGSRWTPAYRGTPLQLPVEGSLNDLRETYSRFLGSLSASGVDADTRPAVYRIQRYSSEEQGLGSIEFRLTDIENDQFRSFPAEYTVIIAAWMRHATAAALREEWWNEDEVARIALGHNEEEKNPDRLLYLPISTIGAGYTDGRIRRVLMAMRGRQDLLDLLRRKINGIVLTDNAGRSMCRLMAGARDRVTSHYLEARTEWATVTPVVLHGHNASGGKINFSKTEKLVAQALEQAGVSTALVEDWAFRPAPFWAGTSGARSIRVPKHLERWPRYHLWIRFREKVAGPVVAGIGRHYGLGIFAGVSAARER